MGKGNFLTETGDIITAMPPTAGHGAEDEHFDGQMSLVTLNLLDNPAENLKHGNSPTF